MLMHKYINGTYVGMILALILEVRHISINEVA